MLKAVSCFALCAVVCACLSSCGTANSASGGGGGSGTTPASTEYLYSVAEDTIEVYKVNTGSGNLSLVQNLQPPDQNQGLGSSAVFKQGNNQYLFVVAPLAEGIYAFSIGSDGNLTSLNDTPYTVPQSISSSPQIGTLMPSSDGTHLYALDVSGSIYVITVGSTGAITYDSLVRPSSLEIGFGYDAVLDPSGQSIYYTTDGISEFNQLGDDYSAILGYSLDPSTGAPTPMSAPSIVLPPNSQPVFITNDPTGQFYYVGLENSDTIAAFSQDSSTGVFTEAAGSPYTAGASGAQITGFAMHPSGKYLYTVDGSTGGILGYAINSSTGALTPLPGSPFPAQTASNEVGTQGPLAVDPSGNLLLVSMNGSYTAIYKINQSTGALSVAGSPQSTQGGLETFSFLTMN